MGSQSDYFKNISSQKSIAKSLSELKKWNNTWNKINAPIAKFNNKGIEHESNGEIKKAIAEYEKCLKYMYDHFDGEYLKNLAWHSPDRLRILYKKEKHPNEKQFLQTFISFCEQNGINAPEAYRKQLAKIN